MFCPNCGAMNEGNSRFCGSCGAPLIDPGAQSKGELVADPFAASGKKSRNPEQDYTQNSYPQQDSAQNQYPQQNSAQSAYSQQNSTQSAYQQQDYTQNPYHRQGYQQQNYTQNPYQQPGGSQPGYGDPQNQTYGTYGYPPYGAPQYPDNGYGTRMINSYGITPRSIPVAIILSLVSCGIYLYYWIYKVNEEINQLADDPNATGGGMVILFMILTCGIYGFYWSYKMGEKNDYIKNVSGSSSILMLVLSLFGLMLVNVALLQDTINKTI